MYFFTAHCSLPAEKKTTLKSLNSCLNKLIIKDLHSNRLKCDTFQI